MGEEGRGFRYISEALDLERFTMFTFSPIEQKLEELIEYVREAKRDGRPLRDDPFARQTIAQLTTQAEVARVLGLRFVAAARNVGHQAAHRRSLRVQALRHSAVAARRQRHGGPGRRRRAAPRAHAGRALRGRPDMSYRYSVIDTIGGGASEIQKNIIARRKLGLPKNF